MSALEVIAFVFRRAVWEPTRQPREMMCIHCGATRPTFRVPRWRPMGGLEALLIYAVLLHTARMKRGFAS